MIYCIGNRCRRVAVLNRKVSTYFYIDLDLCTFILIILHHIPVKLLHDCYLHGVNVILCRHQGRTQREREQRATSLLDKAIFTIFRMTLLIILWVFETFFGI